MTALVLPYPVSTNRYWRIFRGKAVPSKEARAYKLIVKARAREAGIVPIIGHVSLHITLRPKRNKDGAESKVCIDLDNALKVILDALNGVAYGDDSQIVELYVAKGSAVDGGGLVVSISEGKRLGAGRKSLGERKSKTFNLPINCSDWLDKQGNKNAAVVALIEKAIENEA